MFKKVALAVAVALAAQGAAAASIDFHGYMRAGLSGTDGGTQSCYEVGGAADKGYRLGNECDNYTEFSFGSKLYKGNNGEWANYNLRFATKTTSAVDSEYINPQGFDRGGLYFASRENFVQAGGFFGDGAFKEAKIWLGKRFYNRHDLHIKDFYYWNNSGNGVGIEDVNVGLGKFAYALQQSEGYGSAQVINRHEFRWYDVPVNPDGKLELALMYLRGSKKDASVANGDTSSGYILTAQHQQNSLLGGFNKVALQYGKGLGGSGNAGYAAYHNGGFTAAKDMSFFRLTEQLVIAPEGTDFSGQFAFIYEKNKNDAWGGGNQKWLSFGFRPQYAFTENLSVAAEYGFDKISGDGSSKKLQKITVAPQIQAGKGFWARPVFRLYASYFKADYAIKGTDKSDFTYGAQVEAWW